MSDEKLGNELAQLEAKEMAIQKQVQDFHRKLMVPVWLERREMVKQIPNFWAEVISNTPIFVANNNEHDTEALEHLTDFHVEYDENRPDYRKVVATFKNNGIFKNEQLTKEFTLDEEDGKVISKSTIEYHAGKEPNDKKRKSSDDDDEFNLDFLSWFADDSIPVGAILTEQVFPDAFEIYKQDDEDDEDDDEIELGSDSSEDEEEEETPKKKSKK